MNLRRGGLRLELYFDLLNAYVTDLENIPEKTMVGSDDNLNIGICLF